MNHQNLSSFIWSVADLLRGAAFTSIAMRKTGKQIPISPALPRAMKACCAVRD